MEKKWQMNSNQQIYHTNSPQTTKSPEKETFSKRRIKLSNNNQKSQKNSLKTAYKVEAFPQKSSFKIKLRRNQSVSHQIAIKIFQKVK